MRLDASVTTAPEVEGGHSLPLPSLLTANQTCSNSPTALLPGWAIRTVAMMMATCQVVARAGVCGKGLLWAAPGKQGCPH